MNLPRFDSARVLTIGDAMLDRYWHGATSRVSAEAPIPVVDVDVVEDRLGGAANVVLNVSALGASSALVATLGDDEYGGIIRNKLASAGISDLCVLSPEHQTVAKLRIVSQGQQLVRADFEEIKDSPFVLLEEMFSQGLANCDIVIMSDYDKGVISDPASYIRLAQRRNIPVLVDPKFKDFSEYAGATIIKPNRTEFVKSVGHWQSENELVEKCRGMINALGIEALLVTRDSEG